MIQFKPLVDRKHQLVPFDKPPGVPVELGCLCYPSSASDLDQDYYACQLPDETWLDVGCYPSYDENGVFILVHFGPGIGSGSFDDGTTLIETQNIDEVARVISEFGERPPC